MARKIKMPKMPLSTLDKLIYCLIFLLGCLLPIFLMLSLGVTLPQKLAFRDPSIVASDSVAALLTSALLSLALAAPCALAMYGFQAKQPIFGNKKFKPKTFTPILKTFPIFSKEFRNSLTDKTKRKLKRIAVIVTACILITALAYTFCLYPRNVLDQKNNILTYNSFNQITRVDSIESAQKLIIRITRGRHRTYGISLDFVFEDESYSFGFNNFAEFTTQEKLEYMLYLKEHFRGRYEFANANRIDNLLSYANFTDTEADLIYQLFDQRK